MGIFDFIKKKEPANEVEKSKALSLNRRSNPRLKPGAAQNLNDDLKPQTHREKSQSVVTAPIHPIKQTKVEEHEPVAAPTLHLNKTNPPESVSLSNVPKVEKLSIDDLEREKLNLKSQRLSKNPDQENVVEPSELDKTQVDHVSPIDLSEAAPLKAPILGESPQKERKELKITTLSDFVSKEQLEESNESAYSTQNQVGQDIKVIGDQISIPLSKFTENQTALIQQSELLNLSSISISLNKNTAMQFLSTGAFKLTIKELIELASKNPFVENTDHATELEIDLNELMPLIPAEWFSLDNEQDSKAIDSLSDIENPFNFEGEESPAEAKPEERKKKSSSTNLLSSTIEEEQEDTLAVNIEEDEEETLAVSIEEDEEETLAVSIEEDEEETLTVSMEENKETSVPNNSPSSLFSSKIEEKHIPAKESSSLFDDNSPKKSSQSLFATEDSLATPKKEETLQVKAPNTEPENSKIKEEKTPPPTESISSDSEMINIDLQVFIASFEAAGYSQFQAAYISNKLSLTKEKVAPLLMSGRVTFSISDLLTMIQPPMSLDIADQSQEIELSLTELLNHVPMSWMAMEGQAEDHLAAIDEIDDPFSSDADGNFSSQEGNKEEPTQAKKSSSNKNLNLLSGDLNETADSRPSSPSKDDLIRDELNRNLEDETINLQFAESTETKAPEIKTFEEVEESEKKNGSQLFAEAPTSIQSDKAPAVPAKANELSETIDNSLFAQAEEAKAPASSGLIIEEASAPTDQTLAEPESPKSLTASGIILEEPKIQEKATEAPRKERTSSFLKSTELQRPSSAPNGIDLNRCSVDEVLDISYDIEESIAKAIIDLREQKGGFTELREILELDQVSAHDFKILTGMSPSDNLVESERKLNRMVKLDRRKDYSLAQIVDTAQEEFDFKSIVLSSKDGLQICAAGDTELFDTNSELLASISPQLFKKTKQFIEQSMLPQPDLFTFYTKDNPVTFAPAGEIAIVFIHDSPWPTPGQMAKARNLVAELGWFCSRRLVL